MASASSATRTALPFACCTFGGVRIGNRVEVGSVTTVCQGTLGPTIIEDDAKVDDHVHVAHNCRIKKMAFVIACAELSGGVVVGERAWIGPNASVLEKVTIGDDALVGLGAVVLRNVANGVTVVGNPAKRPRDESQSHERSRTSLDPGMRTFSSAYVENALFGELKNRFHLAPIWETPLHACRGRGSHGVHSPRRGREPCKRAVDFARMENRVERAIHVPRDDR